MSCGFRSEPAASHVIEERLAVHCLLLKVLSHHRSASSYFRQSRGSLPHIPSFAKRLHYVVIAEFSFLALC
jgi:hypothetical protein